MITLNYNLKVIGNCHEFQVMNTAHKYNSIECSQIDGTELKSLLVVGTSHLDILLTTLQYSSALRFFTITSNANGAFDSFRCNIYDIRN